MRLGTTMGGRYRLTRGPLRGGMSEVWLARDQRLPRDVVLKRLLAADGTAPFDVLEAEARALARFGHPHVVTLHDVLTLPAPGRLRVGRGRRTRQTRLVMEYVCGGSLEDRPPLPPRRAARRPSPRGAPPATPPTTRLPRSSGVAPSAPRTSSPWPPRCTTWSPAGRRAPAPPARTPTRTSSPAGPPAARSNSPRIWAC
ncbi:hypothetical protein MOV08_11615 [Streptomyces yunnanensis]|uniref:Protein kinase domain-containing protein n=1 Tax=Streptomyces yunnanensis TaxID=156453 RepID=A0ABY8A4I2_9ACTN|nr:hypothetical protein [Streptomyces yunnanensis]WEB39860.1 hypothetical protein MOV08_11615 [Streptomyces yunnanensis]